MGVPQGKSSKRKVFVGTSKKQITKKGSVAGKITENSLKSQTSTQKELPQSLTPLKKEILRVKKASIDLNAALNSLRNVDNTSGVQDDNAFNRAVNESLEVTATIARLYEVKDHQIKNQKRAKKLWPMVRPFLKNMIILSKSLTEPEGIINIVAHGILPVLPLYREVDSLCKALIKQLAVFWNTSHEKLRTLSFIALYRIAKLSNEQIFELVTKEMYLTYLQTCKHTSKTTIGIIQFMRTSLKEVYVLNTEIAYKQAFVNIRQLAILLRSAFANKTQKDNAKMIFNWQFLHSLCLWEQVISMAHPCPLLNELIYPLTQVSFGVLELQKSPSLYPMYFHVFKLLTSLSKHTDTYIEVLPHIFMMLDDNRLTFSSKEDSDESFIEWDYIFRLNGKQLKDTSFGDQLTNMIVEHLIEYLAVFSNSIAFPELVSVVTLKMKEFMKNCRVPYRKNTIKATLQAVQENSKFIENLRKDHHFSIKNREATNAFEMSAAQANPPLIAAVEKLRKKKAAFENENSSKKKKWKTNADEQKDDDEEEQNSSIDDSEDEDQHEESLIERDLTDSDVELESSREFKKSPNHLKKSSALPPRKKRKNRSRNRKKPAK